MTDFPTIVYRVPGPHYGADGRGFGYLGVADQSEYDAALADGWHPTMDEAMGVVHEEAAAEIVAEVAEAHEAVEAVDAGTREAMEARAKELGVSFNSRTSDMVLAERIAAAE